jgi:hypothetical protein
MVYIPFTCMCTCIINIHFSHVENDSSPLELASTSTVTCVSPPVAEPSQDSSKPTCTSTSATKRSTGSVKRLSAFFEAKDKQQLGAEGR